MAAEFTFTASLSIAPASMNPFVRSLSNVVSMSGQLYIHQKVTVTTSPTALDLGGVATASKMYLKNWDPTNPILVRNGAGGTDTCQIEPLGEYVIPLKSGALPYVTGSGGSCVVEYCISVL